MEGDLDLAFAFVLALALALPKADGSTLSANTMGVTGVERALTRRLSILILPLVEAGAVEPWSDDVVIGVTDSAPVVELASKESLSLAMACAIISSVQGHYG